MKIYKYEAEINELAVKINANCSITYASPLFAQANNIINKTVANRINNLVLGSEEDDDLYPTKSVLVSTNWNLNDDVFGPYDTWTARYTPSHKPTNLEHDEHELVGHITNTWVISNDGNIIPDDIEVQNLPHLFHIVNGAVIYKCWQDEKLVKRTATLIEEIKKGEKFVSMECLFADFDYAIIDNGQYKIVSRNDETSWLTKHLRAYGGDGVYEGIKVGRLLKNIKFCGKGYVSKPANPNSIIFNTDDLIFDFSKASYSNDFNRLTHFSLSGVSSNEKENTKGEFLMSDMLKEQNDKLEAQVKELSEKLEKANELLANASTSKLESRINELEKEVATANETINSKDNELVSKAEEINKLQTKVTELVDANSKFETEIQKIRASEIRTNRISKLVDGGVSKEKAETKVDLFANLNDEQFDAVANELIEVAKKMSDEDKEKEEDKSKCSVDIDVDKAGEASVVDNVVVEPDNEPSLSVASENNDDKVAELRKELAGLLAKKKNTKEQE